MIVSEFGTLDSVRNLLKSGLRSTEFFKHHIKFTVQDIETKLFKAKLRTVEDHFRCTKKPPCAVDHAHLLQGCGVAFYVRPDANIAQQID